MPEINQNTSIRITPERFLDACSAMELYEVDLLIQSARYQNKIASAKKETHETFMVTDDINLL